MSRSTTHDLQPQTDHDGMSRRLAVLACKNAIRSRLQPRFAADFDDAGDPTQTNSYRVWSGINRASQDRMWAVLAEQIDSDYTRIAETAQRAAADAEGSLDVES